MPTNDKRTDNSQTYDEPADTSVDIDDDFLGDLFAVFDESLMDDLLSL